jgi:hypothetical protein
LFVHATVFPSHAMAGQATSRVHVDRNFALSASKRDLSFVAIASFGQVPQHESLPM